jgi:periplasmic protein TonB
MLRFHTFVSSRAYRSRPLGGVSLSLVVHGGLIATAVTLTARSVDFQTVRDLERVPAEQLMLVEAARLVRATSDAAARSVRKVLARPKAPRLTLPDLAVLGLPLDVSAAVADAIPTVATDIDLAEMATQSLSFASDGGLARAMLRSAFPTATKEGAYTADVVERTVWPRTGNPLPAYPPTLLDARVEASFVVRFVVDSTGRVDTRSIVFPTTAHRLFVAAVRNALQRSRYLPAELGGHPVRQLVEQQFSFRLER